MKPLLKPGEQPEKKVETTSPQNKPMICPEVLNVLNQQIQNELFSSQIYAAMASWLDNAGWPGGSKLFLKYSKEELTHMYKIYEFIFSRNGRAYTPDCSKPPCDFSNIRDIMNKSLVHEMGVTANWENIANVAKEKGCNESLFFSKWFLDEQVEEEEKFRNLLFALDRGTPDWRIDEILSSMA